MIKGIKTNVKTKNKISDKNAKKTVFSLFFLKKIWKNVKIPDRSNIWI